MKFTKKLTAVFAMASVIAFGGVANADTWTGAGGDGKWETAANWLAGVVPLNGDSGNTFINDGDVLFDADTWNALQAAGNVQSATQYRVVRFILNESTSIPIGTGSITFDHGDGNEVLQTNSTSAIIGSRTGQTTVNMLSGTVNTGSSTTFGGRDGVGILNLSGGSFIVGRGNLVLGNANGAGVGTANITGGVFLTRGGAIINAGSTFAVVGTGSSQVGIGSQGTVDGFWTQSGTLSAQVDSATGITPIFVDDIDEDGGVTGTFEAGSILDLSFVNSPPAATTTYTLLELEGADIVDNGLALSATTAAAWSFAVDNSGPNGLLTATYTASGTVIKGDVNRDGGVTFLDINPFIGVLSSGGSQAEADCDCNGEVDFLDIQAFINLLSGQ